MGLSWIIFIAFSAVDLVYSNPQANDLHGVQWDEDPELAPGFIEGDMIILSGHSSLEIPPKKWPNSTVYYKINEEFGTDHQKAILKSMSMIERVTCVRFVRANESRKDYVEIMPSTIGCSAVIGYQGTRQFVSLKVYPVGKGCFTPGSIVHELLHALGFIHQHSAPYRDEYVEIMWDNIAESKYRNFQILKLHFKDDVGYDAGSVMHYPAKSFSKNGKDTIRLRHPANNVTMGQRTHLSEKDIRKINNVYCSHKEGENRTKIEHSKNVSSTPIPIPMLNLNVTRDNVTL